MDLRNLLDIFGKHPNIAKISESIRNNQHIQVENLIGSAKSVLIGDIFRSYQGNILCVLDDIESAGYFYHDLTQIFDNEQVVFLPPSYKGVLAHAKKDSANEILRTEVLKQLNESNSPSIVVSCPEGIFEKVIDNNSLRKETICLEVGNTVDPITLGEKLYKMGFSQVDFVYEPGQYSIRGSIIDVFSFSHEYPYRIDLFGDEIESIRTFEVSSQLSKDNKHGIAIVPHIKQNENNVSLFNFFNNNSLFVFENIQFCLERITALNEDLSKCPLGEIHSIEDTDVLDVIQNHPTIEFQKNGFFKQANKFSFAQEAQPSFHKNFDLITENLQNFLKHKFQIYILSDSEKQIERLRTIFDDRGDDIQFIPFNKTIHEGFIDYTLKITCYTDHQIFDRYHRYNLKSDNARAGKVALALKEISQMQIGDYIVHADHGIGKFGGLVRINQDGKMQEVIKIIYKDNDLLFVSIHSLHRVSKFRGKESDEPRINKLGNGAWEKLKSKTKSKVKDIARELIALYVKRRENEGFQFSKDSFLQQELEASFIYEDTPDQLKTTIAVKEDMERNTPMDRLVCGDVGFGKTEIAIRAAFKAACDNKQTAVMVPTTVLALQHYKTFKKRLKDFPCKIEYVSRARTTKEIKDITKRLKDGDIDILIGTHRIVGKDIVFKDLGLLIIDEEQKFGVAVKEKIRQMKTNVDTLTLTATPIPRTLQFSLMGARDLSVISTPPPNRYPVQTEIYRFDKQILEEAIRFELSRNGQVFFINNRISNLFEIENIIHEIVPEARVCVGHGQMEPAKLEKVITDFVDHEYDVLIATTIIESGIDMPNVNTIIINNAQNFGLSELHQLRGRVGRSNKKAFCYLFAPPLSSLPTDAKRRLQAIETFAELGSGIHLAMEDLDIRGAGNLLGGEQSGFISDLGFETYHRILDEAVQELRNEEFPELFENEDHLFVNDSLFETDNEIMFPPDYIENTSERMNFYRRINNAKDEVELNTIRAELTDRFGTIPEKAEDLFNIVECRWLAAKKGIDRITLKNNKMTGYFSPNLPNSYYESDVFGKILDYIQLHPYTCQLTEKNGKRLFIINKITNVTELLLILRSI